MSLDKLVVKDVLSAEGLMKINVLLGKNGAGKSRYLRSIEQAFLRDELYRIRYISPERGGVFKRDGSVMANIENSTGWLEDSRRKNQVSQFKAASASLLRDIETIYLRKLQDDVSIRDNHSKNFRNDRLNKINGLISNLILIQDGSNFVFQNHEGETIQPDQISSGESEAVALAVEIMYFFENLENEKLNILLIDEPDVH